MDKLPEVIEEFRDRKWRRQEDLRVKTAADVEAMVEDLGFCLGLTDVRKNLPSVYVAVCGRRDAFMPNTVQKDPEASAAWVLKDEVFMRGNVYYGKLIKGNAMFVAPRLLPSFNAIWGISKKDETTELSSDAQKILAVLRREWEMGTADLRAAANLSERKNFTKAIDELQRKMKVVPQEVLYVPKFTYIWTLAEAKFPDQMTKKIKREAAIRELARCFLQMCGITLLGDLSRAIGLPRWETGKANHELVDDGFAERLETGVYKIKTLTT